MPNPPLPHLTQKPEKEEPFISMELEIAKRYGHTHPEAAEGYFTPDNSESPHRPAHDIANPELEKTDDEPKKDSD